MNSKHREITSGDFTSDVLEYYIRKINNLRIDKSKGMAPHKPILLLSIIELIEYGKISKNRIYPSPLITSTFLKYWSKLSFDKHRANVSLPFFHLKSEGFWHLHPNKGYEKVLKVTKSIRSFSELRKVINYVSLDDNLFLMLSNKKHREILKNRILETYFQDKRDVLTEIFSETKELEKEQDELVIESSKKFVPIKEKSLEVKRKTVFRNTIMSIYDYTCSICKMQLITLDGESIVDAAHIIPFRHSYNNDIRNGFALCKNHHWCFDKGLITVDRQYRINVSSLVEDHKFFDDIVHETILLPRIKKLCPSQKAFGWHRKNVFQT